MSSSINAATKRNSPELKSKSVNGKVSNGVGISAGNTNNILTTKEKRKIKIIQNHDCKSWTYEKGELIWSERTLLNRKSAILKTNTIYEQRRNFFNWSLYSL